MVNLTWEIALFGGMLIGLSATLLLAFNGRIAGISGIVNGAIWGGEGWRWLFLAGMLLGGLIYEYGLAAQATPRPSLAPGAMVLGGFLVGVGTRLGNGCTSGHGVCGLGRLSLRSH
ncbi:MAG: YeeE/YedE family protein [Leptolyngbyaceae cyanobacterium]|mgnify:CR=1 FL=1